MHSRTFIRPVFAPLCRKEDTMSKQRIQLSDHFTYSRLFAVRAALHRHHAVHLHLRHRGRPVCLQLCGQDSLCGGQPHHAAAHAAGHHRLYAGHRRQRHRGHHAGRGRPEKADRYFTLFLLAALVSVSVLAVLGIVFLRPIAVLLGAKGSFWTMRCAMDAS